MRGIIVVYSYTGYTRRAAEAAAEASGWPLAELTVSPPYTGGYWQMVARIGGEMVCGSHRAVCPAADVVATAERVILAVPTWWFTYAWPLHSWVREASWAGRRLYGLVTCGSRPGHSGEELARDSGGALVDILVVRQRQHPAPDKQEIATWVSDVVMKE